MTRGPYLIFEGADGTGKSTIAQALARDTRWPLVHCGPPERLAWEEWVHQATTYGEGPVIFDRLHVGSMVYGRTFRDSEDVTDFENWLVEGQLISRGALLVHTELPQERIDKNLERGPDTPDAIIYEAPEKRATVRRLYREYLAGQLPVKPNISPALTWKYDFSVQDQNAFAAKCETMVRQMKYAHRPDVIAAGNTLNPRVVLIGDQPHWLAKAKAADEGVVDEVRLAQSKGPLAYVTFASQSGRYLHMCMRMAGLGLASTLVVNATTWDNPNQLHRLRTQLEEADDVVCLGASAERRLAEAMTYEGCTISYRCIPHPQHWRRFAYKFQHVYRDLLLGKITTEQAQGCTPWRA